MIREEEVFKIGQFAKPHGIKGELSLVTNSDVLEDAEDPYIVCEMMVSWYRSSWRISAIRPIRWSW